jgi:hypothetical protein
MFQALAGPFVCSRDTQKEQDSISQPKLMQCKVKALVKPEFENSADQSKSV